MIKLKTLLKEAFDRNAIVIDNRGNIHDVKYHGDIIYKFKFLMDNVIGAGFSPKELKTAIQSGTSIINKIIDEFGFLRAGVWSPSKKQLYINWYKPTNQAKTGFIKFMAKYKPTGIWVTDIKNPRFEGMYTTEEFIEKYL